MLRATIDAEFFSKQKLAIQAEHGAGQQTQADTTLFSLDAPDGILTVLNLDNPGYRRISLMIKPQSFIDEWRFQIGDDLEADFTKFFNGLFLRQLADPLN